MAPAAGLFRRDELDSLAATVCKSAPWRPKSFGKDPIGVNHCHLDYLVLRTSGDFLFWALLKYLLL